MNHEEVTHLRDQYMIATLAAMVSNPSVDLTVPENVVRKAEQIVEKMLVFRTAHYRRQDSGAIQKPKVESQDDHHDAPEN